MMNFDVMLISLNENGGSFASLVKKKISLRSNVIHVSTFEPIVIPTIHVSQLKLLWHNLQ
jgi:hypothetical protein